MVHLSRCHQILILVHNRAGPTNLGVVLLSFLPLDLWVDLENVGFLRFLGI